MNQLFDMKATEIEHGQSRSRYSIEIEATTSTKREEIQWPTRYPAGCLTRDKGCGNSLVGLAREDKKVA